MINAPLGGPPRSDGVHLSKILRNIAVLNGALKKEWVEDLSLVEVSGRQEEWWNNLDEASQLRMSIGLAWEEWYIPQLGNVLYHPGEMQVDGIYMTHDGESLDTIISKRGGPKRHVLCLHEVKATYKSTKTVGNLETQWLVQAQTKGYCKGLGTRIAYIHMLFLCGDYKYPIAPQLKVWRVEYTQIEIDDHWDMVVAYMKHHQQQEAEDMMRDTL